jgi:hypothetical protein
MATNLNSFYQKIKSAKPASDVNEKGGLEKDHFALIQQYLFYAQIIFDNPTNLTQKFMGNPVNLAFLGDNLSQAIYDRYAQDVVIPLTIRSITLPNASSNPTEGMIDNDFGRVIFPSKGAIIPDSNVLTIQFLNSEQNVLEHLIYDWIVETKSNKWLYDDHPFSRATIRINYLDQKGESVIFSYDFYGAFPIAYDTINSNHSPESNLERGVSFSFNWFHVNTKKTPAPVPIDAVNRNQQANLDGLSDIIPSNALSQITAGDIRPNIAQNLENLAERFNNNSTSV